MASDRFATYKGKTYLLKFLGETKFGRRAKLAFRDGSKEFWVEAKLVSECSAPANSLGKHYDNRIERDSDGAYCGYPCPVTNRLCCPRNGPCHDCQ